MAEERDDIEINDDKKGGNTKLLIIIIAVLLALVIGLAVMMLTGKENSASTDESAEVETKSTVKKPAIYYTVESPFIVNFSAQSNGAVRYMQVKMKVMAREQEVIDSFKLHLPALQHELLMLFFSQKYDDLTNNEGTKALQQASLDKINQVLKAESSLPNQLEAVYFTSFIMQ